MELASQPHFLSLAFDRSRASSRVSLHATLVEVISAWSDGTRVSPLWRVKELPAEWPSGQTIPASASILFLGPVNPFQVFDALQASTSALARLDSVWLTFGLFNVVVVFTDTEALAETCTWADTNSIRWEAWRLEDFHIVKETFSPYRETVNEWAAMLAAIAKERVADELTAATSEFLAMAASALSRAQEALPSYLPVLKINIESILSYIRDRDDDDFNRTYETQGKIINVNAALSRFSSQAFSGISPIRCTESHFWTHSLLGTGYANLALIKIVQFIVSHLSTARIPQRFAALSRDKTKLPTFLVDSADSRDKDQLFEDHLSKIELTKQEDAAPLVVPISYFSGRDGFKSHLQTISAPLAVLSGCNTIQWTLLTLTHELSHIIVKGILNRLLPDIRSPAEISTSFDLCYGNVRPTSWLETIQVAFLSTLVMELGETLTPGKQEISANPTEFRRRIEKFRGEAEEIMVHVFDFLYFFGQNEKKYVQSIWLSWSVIPNLSERIPEYVMRTLCALLVTHLRRDNPEKNAFESAKRLLTELADENDTNPHLRAAVKYLNDSQEQSIIFKLLARKTLVKIVVAFCYSERVASQLRGEAYIEGGHESTGGYPDKAGLFGETTIQNPLHFVASYTKGAALSERTSFWMLYSIAFRCS